MNRAIVQFVVCILAATGLIMLSRRSGVTSAAETDRGTWGATDPSWSPDGKRLAFSLFGSIWEVPVDGGKARQISSSGGYHGHPAWSPLGEEIVFVSGGVPMSRLPAISGTLKLVNVRSGAERELTTPFPVAGTPAWSPDWTRIACGLRVPNSGSLLHEIRIADGQVTRIQHPVQRFAAGDWTDAGWSRKGEIFFAALRTTAPQVWSMPDRRRPILIQIPLTGYRPADTVFMNSLSALPDGSGVVYSASVGNGRGNYELYRVGREGGDPVPLTETARDEFSPAVSPDGRTVAHVSNHAGNIDIFLMPSSGGGKSHVTIKDLQFRQPSGRVRLKLVDEHGNPTRARVYTGASDGKSYTPPGSPIYFGLLEPKSTGAGFFVASGDDEFPVPAGPLRLTAIKGIEYRVADRTIDVGASETAAVTIRLERWANWMQRGWYTGEDHFHANYNGSYYQGPKDSLAWLEAVDLNSANMVVANGQGGFLHDKQFFRGAPDPVSTSERILYWGQEYRNSDPLGHMTFSNLKALVPPYFTSVIGSNSPYDFPLNTQAALEARKQGGFVSYAHPVRPPALNDVFDSFYGAKEAPLAAALGGLDAIEVLREGGNSFNLWYALLNCGFRLLPGAGTDAFTNWRGMNNMPGGSRAYVEVGGAMSWQRRLARYREGRVFVTNGPLLDFHVNGLPAGSLVRVSRERPYEVRLTAEVTSRVPLSTLQFIRNGQVIASRDIQPGELSMHAEHTAMVNASSWFAVRVSGPAARGIIGPVTTAHSSATFVDVEGQPVLIREDLELMMRWLNRLWAYLEERDNFGPAPNRSNARKMLDDGLSHYRTKLPRAQ